MTTATTFEGVIDRVRSLEPLVEDRRAGFDELRRMPDGLREELIDRELYRLCTPRELGGLQLEPGEVISVLLDLSRIEGALGWNVIIPVAYSFLAGHMEREAAEHIFDAADSIVAGQLQPGGRAQVVEHGFEVSGRWPFGSACGEATWLLAQCAVEGDTDLEPTLPGMPLMRLMFAPTEQCEIDDTWHTGGLRGTGSNDYSMDGVHVPADHTADLFANRPVHEAPLYRFPTLPLMRAALAAVPLGIARSAIDTTVEIVTTKRSFPANELHSERETVRAGIARAENLVGAAEALLRARIADVWTVVQEGGQPSARQRGLLRGAAAHAGESSVEAVDLVYGLGGSTAIYESSRLERCFRDVHAARAHVAVSNGGLIEAGTLLLGFTSPAV